MPFLVDERVAPWAMRSACSAAVMPRESKITKSGPVKAAYVEAKFSQPGVHEFGTLRASLTSETTS
jgi:hypothetical protein